MHYLNLSSILFIFLLIFYSCSHDKDTIHQEKIHEKFFEEYKNQKDLINYFEKTFDVKVNLSSDTIIFIPLNSCDKCVDELMSAISSNSFNGKIVFGGEISQMPIFKTKYQFLIENFNCLVDEKSMMYRYNIKVTEPAMILGNNIYQINYGNIKEIKSVLNWN